MYRQVLDAVNQGIVILTRDYKVVEWNRWMEIHSGISRDKIIDTSIFNHYPNLNYPSFIRGCKSVTNFGNYVFFSQKLHKFLFPFTTIGVHSSKQEMMQQSCTIAPLREDDGSVQKVIITVQDVTESVYLENELKAMSQQDSLTGLYNRRYFDSKLTEEINRCGRNEHDLSLIMIDIDDFKILNDQFGHQYGDLVLKEIARTCALITRNCDTLARFGGEEFCVILPESDIKGAAAFAERLRMAVEVMVIRNHEGKSKKVTISLGIASMGQGADNEQEILRCADSALYESKKNGKNMVTVYSD